MIRSFFGDITIQIVKWFSGRMEKTTPSYELTFWLGEMEIF